MMSLNEDLVKLFLKISEKRRKEYGDRIWQTVTYFTAVLSAILSVSATLFELSQTSWIGGLLIVLLSLGIFVSITAWFNVRREYERQIEAMVEIGKAQEYLGLTAEIPMGKRWFKQDPHIILERYLKDKGNFQKDEEWVKDKMKLSPKRALFWFSLIFWGFAFIYTIAVVLVIYSVFPNLSLLVNVYWIPLVVFAAVSIVFYAEHIRYTRVTT
jgi:hypothetical protein